MAGQTQVLELTLEKNARREWTVRGDAFPALPAEPATVAAAAPPEPQALPAPGNATLDLELVQVEPQRYSQRLVKATTVRGRIAEGRFTGLDSEGRLVIRRKCPVRGGELPVAPGGDRPSRTARTLVVARRCAVFRISA